MAAITLLSDSDEQLLKAIPDFPRAVASAAAASAIHDGVLTVGEYEALAACAASLESLSALPGLMSVLILHSLTSSCPRLEVALSDVRRAVREIPADTRRSVLQASLPMHVAQGSGAAAMHAKWASALDTPPLELPAPECTENLRWFERGRSMLDRVRRRCMSSPTDPATALVARAKTMASCFQDDELRQAIVRWERSADVGPDLEAEMDAAAQRAYTAAVSRLKSAHDLREQQVVTQRFLKTTEVLLEQVQARLEGIADRLRFQNEMFDEDVRAFIDSSLDAIELRMRETVRGRPNWTEEATWEAFRNGAAYAELRARFEPLRSRYTRLFDLWERELEAFSHEGRVVRRTVLGSIDPRAFSGLVPTQHSLEAFKTAVDRVAEATLGLSMLGALGVGAVAVFNAAAAAAVVTAALSNPVGLSVLGAVGLAAAWRIISNPDARKQKLIRKKREDIREKLTRLLSDEGLNHERTSAELLEKFADAAREHYAPLLIEARVWALKARLEPIVITRKSLTHAPSYRFQARRFLRNGLAQSRS